MNTACTTGSASSVPTLSQQEIAILVSRCPEQHRWAFEGWLNGTHQLDGDLIDCDTDR